eukprot:CAMPEP_0202338392 /NCGR_PEP_ID=MMETSP1126-20121109/683_1 /ASSEMBLY_ACC=CAM_ASM_000457 /TAXON_ID=3047 /ORGANISM="Dunaliella tertiolecta, Strain CCMP1320" /LENGTH=106 /DNA_ID=CAMNT_0048928755 /DNA_START=746 /DNA_END=1066 /DNA_ORIENTATION=+
MASAQVDPISECRAGPLQPCATGIYQTCVQNRVQVFHGSAMVSHHRPSGGAAAWSIQRKDGTGRLICLKVRRKNPWLDLLQLLNKGRRRDGVEQQLLAGLWQQKPR